jgi:hypothetical protein
MNCAFRYGDKTNKCMKVYGREFLHVSATHVGVLRKFHYKGWTHQDLSW